MTRTDLSRIEFTGALVKQLDPATAHLYGTLPVREEGTTLFLALAPRELLLAQEDDAQTVRTELEFLLGRKIEWVLADRDQLREYVGKLYGGKESGNG